jgi:lipopolysaccharide export system protein LptC
MSAPARWTWRVREMLSSYLPLLLMAGLALATWWLVKNTPVPGDVARETAPRHEPDYTMRAFSMKRFARQGPLRVQIDGETLRHYPDTDTLEIDNPSIRTFGSDGRLTIASARRAITNADATEVQLVGSAQVRSESPSSDEPIEMKSEFLHAFLDTERVRSHLPVWVKRGATEVRAEGFEYDNLTSIVQFRGKVRAVIAARPTRPAP